MSKNADHFRYIKESSEPYMQIKNKEELVQMIQCILDFLGNPQVSLTVQNAPIAVQDAILATQPAQEALPAAQAKPDKKSMLMSDEWPEAVPAFLICDETEEDKLERAEGMIDAIEILRDTDLTGKKILDFGCGEGHLVKTLGKLGHNVIGYDIKKQGNLEWNESENPCVAGEITTNWGKVLSQKPFDLVVLYDVIDHCKNPVAALKAVHSICHEKTKVFLRSHPFCGPHGGHAYRKVNKAYVHLFFNEDELKEMGVEPEFVQKVFFPLKTIADWFQKSNFKIMHESMTKVEVPEFFKKPEMVNFLLETFPVEEFPEWQMSQAFNDYIIQKR